MSFNNWCGLVMGVGLHCMLMYLHNMNNFFSFDSYICTVCVMC